MNRSDSLAARYGRIPYPALTYDFAHPSRMGAIARLFGSNAPDPQTSRILEIATGRGKHLAWVAKTLPQAHCLGLELVEGRVRESRDHARMAGLENIEFRQGDLLTFEIAGEEFDYILCHGMFSWVEEEVQQRLLELCRDHLAPSGLAMISYKTLPGCSTPDALRRLFLLEMDEQGGGEGDDLRTAVAAVDRVLDLFAIALPGVTKMPHAAELEANIDLLRDKDRAILLHDEAAPISEPYYLLQFTQWAAETGLTYVADADLRQDWIDVYPKPIRQAIVQGRMPRLKALQFADYLFHTRFRRSLVCREEDAHTLRPMPEPADILKIWVASDLRPVDSGGDASPDRRRYSAPAKEAVEAKQWDVDDPAIRNVLDHLASQEGPLPMSEVWQTVRDRNDSLIESTNDAIRRVGRFVLEATCHGQMRISLGPISDPID